MTAAGVKPIIGIEAYFTPNIARHERKRVNFYDGGPDDVSSRGAYTHMTLLSESTPLSGGDVTKGGSCCWP